MSSALEGRFFTTKLPGKPTDNLYYTENLHPDILEHKVKRALGNITMNKASGGDRIPAELFQILKDDAVNVLHSICQQIGKLSSGHGTGKGQFSFQSQRRVIPNNVQTTAQLYSFHMLAR